MKWHSPYKNRKKAKNKGTNKFRKNLLRKATHKSSVSQKKQQRRSIEVRYITISPLGNFHNFFKDSVKRSFKPTIETINNFFKGGQYNINLNYESLNNGKQQVLCPLKINQSNRKGVNFKISLPNDFTCRGVTHKEGYGLGES